MTQATDWLIGIDFGTAWSKAAAGPRLGDGAPPNPAALRALPLGAPCAEANPLLLASALFLEGDQVYFGPAALAAARACQTPKREVLQSFKTILSAGDLASVLETRPRRPIDPEGRLTYRDLLTLYFAFLLDMLDRAAQLTPGLPPAEQRIIRFTRPGWATARTAQDHALIIGLFQAGEQARRALPDRFWAQALPLAHARTALDQPAGAALLRIEAGVFEASAVAACHAFGAPPQGRMVVVDIGAGTTDLAAFTFGAADGALGEIPAARQTLARAGDIVDRALLNLIVEKAKAKGAAAQSVIWREQLPQVRAQKEAIVRLGKTAIRTGGKSFVIARGDLEKTKAYKELAAEIAAAFQTTLEAAAEDARAGGVKQLELVAAGGGASLPFLAPMLSKAKTKKADVKIIVRPLAPAWAHDPVFDGALAPVFQQLAIALGAVLAPQALTIA